MLCCHVIRLCVRRGRLQELGYDEAAEAALEAAVKAEAGEVRRCRGRVDELAAMLSGAPAWHLQGRLTFHFSYRCLSLAACRYHVHGVGG